MEVEAAVFPGVEDLDALEGQEFLGDQEVDDFGTEEFFERFEGSVRQGEEGGAGWRLEAGGWSWGLRRLRTKAWNRATQKR
jgi:hypothetical protein